MTKRAPSVIKRAPLVMQVSFWVIERAPSVTERARSVIKGAPLAMQVSF